MSITTLSSREFNQDTSKAKRATKKGPVFITDRGRASYVLLSIEDYQKMAGSHKSIVELLAMPDTDHTDDFEPPRLSGRLYRSADLS